ncbi:MAG: hypothetical protein J2P47_03090, partial [Acetobacteraceae bacterium]|nr:hypothetical protein [Acetobacteraceae bacterium]
FNAQHHLKANGYASHEAWRDDWRAARSAQFMVTGSGKTGSGKTVASIWTCISARIVATSHLTD